VFVREMELLTANGKVRISLGNLLVCFCSFVYLSVALNKVQGSKTDMRKYSEAIIWAFALLLLYFMDTSKETTSICIFKLLGFKSCPGCGIGHAIHFALHFNFQKSFHEHILGIPVTIGILYTIINSFLNQNQQNLKWTNNKCL
jgi:hypothetical protein